MDTFALLSLGNISSKVGIWYLGRMTALVRSLGSRQILILFGMFTTTILLIQSVGMVIFSIIPFLSRSSCLALTVS